jgi:hypothetical protein
VPTRPWSAILFGGPNGSGSAWLHNFLIFAGVGNLLGGLRLLFTEGLGAPALGELLVGSTFLGIIAYRIRVNTRQRRW